MQTETVYAERTSAYRSRNIIRPIMGLATGLAGLANMLSVLVPRPNWDMLLGAWPVDIHHGVHKLIVVVGFFLLLLSYGLLRGKYGAWCLTVLLLLLSSVFHILSGGQILGTILTGVFIMLLAACFRSFQAKSDPPSVRRGVLALFASLGIVSLYTISGLLALYTQFESVIDRFGIEEVLLRLLTNAHLHITPGTQAFFFGRALPALCLSAVLYAIMMILRPVTAALFPNEQQRQAVAALTRLYGSSSISYFALDPDKCYFFSASGKSVISYVLEGNVAVVAGDPIGPQEEILPIIQQFLAFCQVQDWRVVFWQVRQALIDLYRTAGLHVLKMGEDAIITTGTFTLAGKGMANVRSSAKRAEKEGVRAVFWHGPVQDAEQRVQMEQISRAWLTGKGDVEMGFSMGRFDAHGDPNQVSALAVDHANRVHAFVTFVPIYGRNGWGLDLMRRAEQAAPGTMEHLLACSIEYLRRQGADIVSLGLAQLSDANTTDHTFLGTSLDLLTHRFGNPGRNRSLFNFKKKFQPCWENRYLVYSSMLSLPKVGWALYRAHQRDASLLTTLSRLLKEWGVGHKAVRRSMVSSPGHSMSGT